VLAVARLLTSAGAVNLLVAGTALAHLVGSVAVGAALGYALAAYVRSFKWDTALLLVAAAFIAAEAAQLVHLETVLVALTAGFCVRNVFPVENERLRGALRRGSLALYLVFFALAGAGLHLEVLANLWPWVLLVAGLRVVALRYGVVWAGRDPAVSPVLAREGWLGLTSQAGVALRLAAVARRAFPEWGVSLETLIVAMIGVHELVGPICFRRALRLAGEVREGEHGRENAEPDRAVLAPGGGV